MTGDTLHGYDSSGVQQEASVGTKQKRRLNCHASFTKDEVRVVVEQPADGVGKGLYNSAQRQCLLHMISSPPRNFDCETSGKVSAPRTEVVLQRGVLEKLPLLLDISKHSSTEGKGTSTDLELPCSVWGFCSLLLVLEGSVKLNHWFGRDSDPSLPSQTLLAADFMACRGVREDIIEHLQTLLIDSIEQSEKTGTLGEQGSDAQLSLAVHQAYARDWHNTQVLRHVPDTFTADVFRMLNGSCDSTDSTGPQLPPLVAKGTIANRAMHLPQDLLARWVASAAPVLDLRSAQLTALQWARLFTAIAQGGDTITELHVQMGTDAGSAFSQKALGSHTDCNQVLRTLAGVLPQLHSLKHVGLHNLTLKPELMPALGQALLDLPPSVSTLTLTVAKLPTATAKPPTAAAPRDFFRKHFQERETFPGFGASPSIPTFGAPTTFGAPPQPGPLPASSTSAPSQPFPGFKAPTQAFDLFFSDLGPLQRGMLFSAIALVRGLRELHMPDWEAIVGQDSACVEPLYGLPHLELVHVPFAKQSSAFPRGLTFKATEVAGAAPSAQS